MLKNILYFVRFPSRLKYWFCYQSYSFTEKLPFYILGNIKKYFFGSLVLFKLVFRHNLLSRRIKTNLDYRKIDFTALNYLRDFDLYLKPSYVYYPIAAKITITKNCNFSCDYCYQKKEKIDEININKLKKILIHLKKLRIKYISFVGGEVFLDFNKLLKYINVSKDFGIETNGLTTNGFWCVERKKLIKYLVALKKAGYTGRISLSIGREHQRQIPLSNFINLHKISRRIFGKNIFLLLIESDTYEEYKSIKKEAEIVLGKNYNFGFIGLVNTDGQLKKRHTDKNLYWTYCQANNLSINRNYTFCQAACSFNKKYSLNLKKNFGLTDYLQIENKLLDLVNQVSFEKIRSYIKAERLSDKINKFYFPCELCIFLSQNPEVLEKVHNKFIN